MTIEELLGEGDRNCYNENGDICSTTCETNCLCYYCSGDSCNHTCKGCSLMNDTLKNVVVCEAYKPLEAY